MHIFLHAEQSYVRQRAERIHVRVVAACQRVLPIVFVQEPLLGHIGGENEVCQINHSVVKIDICCYYILQCCNADSTA